MNTTFVEWLNEELDARGWYRADLSRATGIHKGSISNVMNGKRPPTAHFVLSVARALKVNPEGLYRRAGILPPKPSPNHDPLIDEAIQAMARLSEDDKREIVEYARFKYHRAK